MSPKSRRRLARRPPLGAAEPSTSTRGYGALAPEVITLGEALVALVAEGSAAMADVTRFHRHVAGAEANVAVGVARLGHSVAFVGRVGKDGFGTAIVRRLRAEGVDVTGVSVEAASQTGVLVRERRSIGASEVEYYRLGSAGSRLSPTDVEARADSIRTARWLHLTGITPALSATARAAVERAVGLAREGDATVSLDVNLRRKLWADDEASSVLWPLASQVDVVFGDPDELAVLAGGTNAPNRLSEAGVGTVVVKLGVDGAELHDAAAPLLVEPALPVLQVVDEVGAGDAFCAGFIAARLEGLDHRTALGWANACGAAVVSVEGDIDGLPSRAEVVRLLAGAGRNTIR